MKSVLQTAALLIGSVSAKAEWDYLKYGEDAPWDGECKSGKNQSPINLILDPAQDTYPRASGDKFTKNYNNQPGVTNTFNGHTTQLNFDANNGKMQFTSQISS